MGDNSIRATSKNYVSNDPKTAKRYTQNDILFKGQFSGPKLKLKNDKILEEKHLHYGVLIVRLEVMGYKCGCNTDYRHTDTEQKNQNYCWR